MSIVIAKLDELGLALPPIHSFPNPNRTGAVPAGELLFISGHPPASLPGVKTEGKVGSELTEEEAYLTARACALNILSTVQSVIGDLDKVKRVVKLLGFVNSAPGFARQFAVIDGASDLYVAVFGPRGVSARSAVGMFELPRRIPVEIEAIFQIEGPSRR
jgi:enamine deaminase RidA (YjgF/YER057c/UK114 family)